jgi:hypothetical protein
MEEDLRLKLLIKEYYENGLNDEYFVKDCIECTFGGSCYKSSANEDKYSHIDLWWDSPKGLRLGIDVKGIKKSHRYDNNIDDSIHWIEYRNIYGYPGWIYGKSDYIAFITKDKIIFVRTKKLCKYSEDIIDGKIISNINPIECYVPYQRPGRKDIIYKLYTSDLEKLSDFIIHYNL